MITYIAFMRYELKLQLRYRGEVFLNSVSSIFPLIVYAFLWMAVYKNGGRIGTYSHKEIFTYYLWVTFLYGTMPIYAYSDILYHIKDGTLIHFLVKPFDYITYMGVISLTGNLFWTFMQVLILIPFGLIFHNLLILPDLSHTIYAVLLFLSGFILSLLTGILFNLTAFYWGETFGIFSLYSWFIGFLGGGFIPLDILPSFFKFLPFKYLYFIPASVLSMRRGCNFIDLLEEALWILVVLLVLRSIWKKGLKSFEAGGG